MKKIGIITNYHLNRNYGGLLQAYALQKTIERYGVEATQVSFIRKKSQTLSRRLAKTNIRQLIDRAYRKFRYKLKSMSSSDYHERNKLFDDFEDSVASYEGGYSR